MHSIPMNPLLLPLVGVVFFVAGFLLRTAQIRKSKKKIISLENEMLKNHAEILQLHQDIVMLQDSVAGPKTRVVSIKEAGSEENKEAGDPVHRKRIK